MIAMWPSALFCSTPCTYPRVCILLLGTSCLGGGGMLGHLLTSYLLSVLLWTKLYSHFFCNFSPFWNFLVQISQLLKLSISSINVCACNVCHCSLLHVHSSHILKLCSIDGETKAFSVCTSRLTAVTLYYGTITFIYVVPTTSYSIKHNKVMSLFHTVVIPMWNSWSTVWGKEMLRRPWGRWLSEYILRSIIWIDNDL
jgi:olfactory receptor